MTAADPHLDTGAFALHALPADEASAAESHFETCDSCAAELAGFLETAALLGSAVAEAPPASLRRTILARIAVTPQLPPLMDQTRSAPTGEPPADRPDRSGGRHRSPTDSEGAPDNVRPLRPWYRRPRSLIAAAVAAVVIGGGTVVAVNQLGGQQEQVAQTPEQCVAQAADQQLVVPAKGAGTVTYAQSCNAALLDVTGLPGLPADRTYQLWALAGDQPRSLGLLPEAAEGKPQVATAQPQPGETVVAITAEPAGGSPAPTLPIVWQATLTS